MQKMRKMKASGIEWIGEIPEGWEVVPVKRLCTMQAGKNLTSEQIAPEGTYPVYGGNGIRGFFSDYNCDGQFLTVGRQGALCGNVHKINGKVWATEHAVITTPSSYTILDFLYYLLIGMDLNQYVSSTAAQPGLAVGTLLNLKTCYPCSTLEQTQISNYLNAKCSEIDTMLSKTRASIEEYKKLKQSVITQAVTKTIYDDFGNPSKFRKLRSLCDVLSKGTTPKDIETQNDEFYCIRYLKSENIVSNQLNLNPTFFITAETNNSLERSKLNSGDILFVIAGASIGKVAITTADFLPANTNQAVAFIRLSSSYQYATKYIWYFLQSDVVKQLIALSAVQSAQPNLSLEDLGAMRLPLPDQMGCLKITDYLDAKCAEIDKLIAKKEQLVKELESYKKSLIYEVVTGKREV